MQFRIFPLKISYFLNLLCGKILLHWRWNWNNIICTISELKVPHLERLTLYTEPVYRTSRSIRNVTYREGVPGADRGLSNSNCDRFRESTSHSIVTSSTRNHDSIRITFAHNSSLSNFAQKAKARNLQAQINLQSQSFPEKYKSLCRIRLRLASSWTNMTSHAIQHCSIDLQEMPGATKRGQNGLISRVSQKASIEHDSRIRNGRIQVEGNWKKVPLRGGGWNGEDFHAWYFLGTRKLAKYIFNVTTGWLRLRKFYPLNQNCVIFYTMTVTLARETRL